MRWCRVEDLFGSQIPVTTGGFETWQFKTCLEVEVSQHRSATAVVK